MGNSGQNRASMSLTLAPTMRQIPLLINQSIPSMKLLARFRLRSAVRNDVIACLERVAHAGIVIIDAHVVKRHECKKSYDLEGFTDAQKDEAGAGEC